MKVAWKELLSILPQWMRTDVDKLGKESLQELRLRINAPPELVTGQGSAWLEKNVSVDDMQFCINAASQYSPWAAETTASGYLTAPGGHRIGLCGEVVIHNDVVTGIRRLQSLCIRVARDFPGISEEICISDSILILGAPGWGKTTMLRDVARAVAQRDTVSVVDERGELYPEGFQRGKRMDVLCGCPKAIGIDRCIRTMGPQWVALDEITAERDCEALLQAIGCGVKLLATAHAASLQDFRKRPVYRKLADLGVFSSFLVLNQKKQWHMERMNG